MDTAEFVAVVRDLTIIMFTMVGVLGMTIVIIIALLLYRKIAPTLDSAKTTMKTAQEISSQLSEKVLKPLIGASTMSYTAGRVVGFVLGLLRGKGGKKNGK